MGAVTLFYDTIDWEGGVGYVSCSHWGMQTFRRDAKGAANRNRFSPGGFAAPATSSRDEPKQKLHRPQSALPENREAD